MRLSHHDFWAIAIICTFSRFLYHDFFSRSQFLHDDLLILIAMRFPRFFYRDRECSNTMSGALWAKRDERGISRESLVSRFAGNPAFASLGTQAPVMQATGDQRTNARISVFYMAFSLKWSQLSYRGLSLSLSILRIYFFFQCVRFILLVHFFFVYVSSVYFLLYKHTGGYSPIKVPKSCFMGVTQIHFPLCGFQSNNNKLYKGTETTLAAVPSFRF